MSPGLYSKLRTSFEWIACDMENYLTTVLGHRFINVMIRHSHSICCWFYYYFHCFDVKKKKELAQPIHQGSNVLSMQT